MEVAIIACAKRCADVPAHCTYRALCSNVNQTVQIPINDAQDHEVAWDVFQNAIDSTKTTNLKYCNCTCKNEGEIKCKTLDVLKLKVYQGGGIYECQHHADFSRPEVSRYN